MASRLLEYTRDRLRLHRVQATVSHCYLLQDRIEPAINRASASLRLLRELPEGLAAAGDDATHTSACGSDGVENLRSLALIVLVKAHLKQGDVAAAQAQVEALLEAEPYDVLLLASICEELAPFGPSLHPSVVRILEHFVDAIDGAPLRPRSLHSGRPGTLLESSKKGDSMGPAGNVAIRSEMLAAATRSLIEMRMKAGPMHAAASSAEPNAADAGTGATTAAECVGSTHASGRLALHQTLLVDLQRIATRVACDGSAVCDDPSHLEWLSDTAWNLAMQQITVSEVGATSSEANTDSSSSVDAQRHNSGTPAISLRLCAELIEASSELTAALAATESRLHAMVRGQAVVCRCRLRLATLDNVEHAERLEQLGRASSAIAAAFKLHQRWVQAASAAPTVAQHAEVGSEDLGMGATASDTPAPSPLSTSSDLVATLQLLNFEVALHRRDPNVRSILLKVAEIEAVSVEQLQCLAEDCFAARHKELGVLTLERALARLHAADPPDYKYIVYVLRRLMKQADRRQQAWPYMQAVKDLLAHFSDANCPLSPSELQWLLTEAWNKGVGAYKEQQLVEAEQWMACAFTFSNFSPVLASWREKLNDGYQACLKQLSLLGTDRATDFKSRMGRRILEIDKEAAERRRLSFTMCSG